MTTSFPYALYVSCVACVAGACAPLPTYPLYSHLLCKFTSFQFRAVEVIMILNKKIYEVEEMRDLEYFGNP